MTVPALARPEVVLLASPTHQAHAAADRCSQPRMANRVYTLRCQPTATEQRLTILAMAQTKLPPVTVPWGAPAPLPPSPPSLPPFPLAVLPFLAPALARGFALVGIRVGRWRCGAASSDLRRRVLSVLEQK